MTDLEVLRADLRKLEDKREDDYEKLIEMWVWYQGRVRMGEKVPGWILTGVFVGIPALASIFTWWLMAKFPGLMGP